MLKNSLLTIHDEVTDFKLYMARLEELRADPKKGGGGSNQLEFWEKRVLRFCPSNIEAEGLSNNG